MLLHFISPFSWNFSGPFDAVLKKSNSLSTCAASSLILCGSLLLDVILVLVLFGGNGVGPLFDRDPAVIWSSQWVLDTKSPSMDLTECPYLEIPKHTRQNHASTSVPQQLIGDGIKLTVKVLVLWLCYIPAGFTLPLCNFDSVLLSDNRIYWRWCDYSRS